MPHQVKGGIGVQSPSSLYTIVVAKNTRPIRISYARPPNNYLSRTDRSPGGSPMARFHVPMLISRHPRISSSCSCFRSRSRSRSCLRRRCCSRFVRLASSSSAALRFYLEYPVSAKLRPNPSCEERWRMLWLFDHLNHGLVSIWATHHPAVNKRKAWLTF